MRKLLSTLLADFVSATVTHAAPKLDANVAYKDKHVRFTVVTDGLIRMEYSPDGKFVDDKSFVAVNRKYPKIKAKVKKDKTTVTITTAKMQLRYLKDSGKFTPENLVIESKGLDKEFTWRPGMVQKENLKGTTRTLDRWNGDTIVARDNSRSKGQLDDGLLARDGWTFIDDTHNFLFDNDPEWEWVKQRDVWPEYQDWYFMAYGNDYKSALNDYTTLAGKMSLPPRFVFGYWWSRYWAYSDHEFRQLLKNFEDYQIPVEVLVVDMDWHYTDPAHGGWTGWTWNEWLFPQHERFLNFLRDKNLKITLNLHPASGIKKFEAAYPQIARENGIDPSTHEDIPWVSSDKTLMNSVFDHILNPMTQNGVSFWWLDWQQHPFDTKIENLSNTWWLNYVFFSKMQKDRPDVRPLLYHRWGGLGNHRYQIGFSGDSYATWTTLDYMPYFTSTASNVCYGFWSHDIGGHMLLPEQKSFDPELYVRFMQFGTYSPVLRSHSTKNALLKKEPWRFDLPTLGAIRQSIQERYRLAPYIYTIAREAHDTGVSMVRPMYYDYPTADEAYAYKHQYMFGDQMIVRPVTTPGKDGFATIDVWLPDGKWYEKATGTMLDGGKTYTRTFAIDEVPVYIKAGAIIPVHAQRESNLRTNNAPIAFEIYPGGSDTFTFYEDFGDDQLYETEFAKTVVESQLNGSNLTVTIHPRKGKYREMPEKRAYQLRIPATVMPSMAKVNGQISYSHYEPEELAVIINLPYESCNKKQVVELTFPSDANFVDGTIGNMKRFVNAFGGIKDLDAGLRVTEEFGRMATIYEALLYDPVNAFALLRDFRERYNRLDGIVDDQKMNTEAAAWFRSAIGPR